MQKTAVVAGLLRPIVQVLLQTWPDVGESIVDFARLCKNNLTPSNFGHNSLFFSHLTPHVLTLANLVLIA